MENGVALDFVGVHNKTKLSNVSFLTPFFRLDRIGLEIQLANLKRKYQRQYTFGGREIPTYQEVLKEDLDALRGISGAIQPLLSHSNECALPIFHERVLSLRENLEKFCAYVGVEL